MNPTKTPVREEIRGVGHSLFERGPVHATFEELEETARFTLLPPNKPPLIASDLDELRQTFGARW